MTHDHVQAHAVQIQYSQLGLRPLEDFVGPQSARRCACLVCGEIHEVAYAEIRNQHQAPPLPDTDLPQAAGSNFSSNVSLEPSGTGYVENLVRL
jgi:hypothetical protein